MVVADDPSTSLIVGVACSATLAWVCVTDLRERLIPNRALIFGAAPVLVSIAAISPEILPGRFLWAFVGSLPFTLVSWFRPEAMGMGDAKLVAFLGLCLGPAVVTAVICALVAGGLAAVLLFARRGLAARKATIPFAPYLALGAVLGAIGSGWGPQITHMASS